MRLNKEWVCVILLVWVSLFCVSPLFAEDPWIGYAAGGSTGKIFIFGIPSLRLFKEVPVGIDIHGPVFSGTNKGNNNGTPDGKFLFAVDKAADNLIVLDLATSKIAKTIPLPKKFGPKSLDISHDGKTLCIGGELSGQIAKVDVASGKIETVKLEPKPRSPVYVAMTKDGKYCLVSDFSKSTLMIVGMDPFKVEKEIGPKLGFKNPHGIVVTPDNRFALISHKFSSNVAFMNLKSLEIETVVKTGAVPIHSVVDSTGKFAYQSHFVGNVVTKIDLDKRQVVDIFPVRLRPGHLAITPDDKYLLVLNKYSTGIFEEFQTSLLPPKGGGITPNNFEIIETATGKSIKQVPVLGEPIGVVVIDRRLVKDGGLSGGKDFVVKGKNSPDIPEKQGAKLSYLPQKIGKPGVFEAKGVTEINMVAFSHEFAPNTIEVFKGDTVRFIMNNIDGFEKNLLIDNTETIHGFTINGYGAQTNVVIPRGVTVVLEFKADKGGEFDTYCSYFCGWAHMEMRGKFVVE